MAVSGRFEAISPEEPVNLKVRRPISKVPSPPGEVHSPAREVRSPKSTDGNGRVDLA